MSRVFIITNNAYKLTSGGKHATTKVGSQTYQKYLQNGYQLQDNALVKNQPKRGRGRPTKQAKQMEMYREILSEWNSVKAQLAEVIENISTKADRFITRDGNQDYTAEYNIVASSKSTFRGFNRTTYNLRGVTSVEGLYYLFLNVTGVHTDRYMILRIVGLDGQLRHITIKPQYLVSVDEYVLFLERLLYGEMQGSDAVEDGSFIDTAFFGVIYFELQGFGKNKRSLFVNEDETNYANGAGCLWNAIFSQIEYDETKPIDTTITSLESLLKPDQYGNLTDILYEQYGYKVICYGDWLKPEIVKEISKKYTNVQVGKKVQYLSEVEVYDESLVVLCDTNDIKDLPQVDDLTVKYIYIVYHDAHYEKYCGIRPSTFYFDSVKTLVESYYNEEKDKDEVYMTKRNVIQTRNTADGIDMKLPKITPTIVSFDVETIYDENYVGLLRPYSISWTIDGEGHFYMGWDCVEHMLNTLTKEQTPEIDAITPCSEKIYALVGYNSSRFDNIFLLPAMLKMDLLTNVFYQKSSLLNIKWGGRHTVHDICRYTLCPLKRACIDFKTKFAKIDGFKFEHIQQHFNENGEVNSFFHDEGCEGVDSAKKIEVEYGERVEEEFDDAGVVTPETKGWTVKTKNGSKHKINKMKYKASQDVKMEVTKKVVDLKCRCGKYNDLVLYNLYDVFSTSELYDLIECVMCENEAIEGFLFDNKTIGSMIYKLFAKDVKNQHIELPALDKEQYQRIRGGLCAGRTQCYKGVSHDLSRQNKYAMLDVKSLYPYIMMSRYFPCGKIIEISYEACVERGLIGFYHCRIDQSTLNKNVLPARKPNLSAEKALVQEEAYKQTLLSIGDYNEQEHGTIQEYDAYFQDEYDIFYAHLKKIHKGKTLLEKQIKQDSIAFIGEYNKKIHSTQKNWCELIFAEIERRTLDPAESIKNLEASTPAKTNPEKVTYKPLDWNCTTNIKTFISTIDIKCLLDAGARVEILKKVELNSTDADGNDDSRDDGFAFSDKIHGKKLFACMVQWKKIKETQDLYKNHKNPAYNPVLRNMAKTILNSLSGKVIENVHLDSTALVRTNAHMEKIIRSAVSTKTMQLTEILTPTAGLVTYERSFDDEYKKQQRPIYLGALIYAYARDHMYRNILAEYDVIYQDTDSALISMTEYDKVARDRPEILGEEFGLFALEDYSQLFDSYITLSPKNYFIMGNADKAWDAANEKEGKSIGEYNVLKKGFKGVNLKCDRFVPDPDNCTGIKVNYVEHNAHRKNYKNIEIVRFLKTTLTGTYWAIGHKVYTVQSGFELYHDMYENKYCEMPHLKTVIDDWANFVDTIYKKGYAYVLCSTLKKSLRTQKPIREADYIDTNVKQAGGIYQTYVLKKITIDKARLEEHMPQRALISRETSDRLYNNRYSDFEDQVVVMSDIDVAPIRYNHSNAVTFDNPNMFRVDFGGVNGNKAFNFESYEQYVKSGIVKDLMLKCGDNFNLNEYPFKTNVATRLWLDIDFKLPKSGVERLIKFCEKLVVGGDNKYLISTEGKLHFILNVERSFPMLVYRKSKSGELKDPTIEYVDSKKERLALLSWIRHASYWHVRHCVTEEEWHKAFDINAPGLNAPFAYKFLKGYIKSKRYYHPYGEHETSIDAKCDIITDCSIYKPVTGKFNRDCIATMNSYRSDNIDKAENRGKADEKACAVYPYDTKKREINFLGKKYKITQKLIDDCVKALPASHLKGYKWYALLRNVCILSKAVSNFKNEYFLHKWSATDASEYNKVGNDEKWSFELSKIDDHNKLIPLAFKKVFSAAYNVFKK
jgi:hypothetical protein